MAALHGAVALEQMHDRAVAVGENLHLDVAGALDQLFEIDLVAAEGGLGLAPRRGEVADQRLLVGDDAHAAPAAAPRRLEHDRVADFQRVLLRVGDLGGKRLGRRHDRNADLDREIARRNLVAQHAHGFGRRADEDDAVFGAGFRQRRIFGQEAVARMNGVGAGFLRHADDFGDRQVGFDRPEDLAVGHFADLVGLVGLEAVQRQLVFLGEDRDGADAELVGGPEHPDGDLRAVGDENLGDLQGNGPRKRCRELSISRQGRCRN